MEKEKCVVCNTETYHRLEHQETKEQFTFCLGCYFKRFYNPEIFNFISPRGKTDKELLIDCFGGYEKDNL